jgi:amino acid transporter
LSTLDWIVVIALVVYVGLAAFSIKFPRGRENWRKDRAETLYLALSATIFLMLLFLLWYVSAVVDWPSALAIIIWSGLIILVILVLVSIFVPRGIRLTFTDKRKKQAEEEE